jgi:hypothetical protein
MKTRSAFRTFVGVVFAAFVVAILFAIAWQTNGQLGPLSATTWQSIATFTIAYWQNLGEFIERNEGAIEAVGTLFVAFFTFTLWASTERLGIMAAEQGEAMEKSIKEAANATEATNAIAKATRDNAALMEGILRKQMRAYITVEASSAVCQDRKSNLRFGASPRITNAGLTPARNVSYQITAAILDANLPNDYQFENLGVKYVNDATLIPRQGFGGTAHVEEYFEESEVEEIMSAKNKRLYVWGTVTYDDIYGGSWTTNFCYHFFFCMDGGAVKWNSYFNNRHNDAT